LCKLYLVVLQNFIITFAINGKGQLPGDCQTDVDLFMSELVWAIEVHHELASQLPVGDQRNKGKRTETLLLHHSFKGLAEISRADVVDADRLRISLVCSPR